MIEQHVLRAQRFASMSEYAFFSAYGQVFRPLSDLPGTHDENARRIFELHRRYGNSVVEVVDRELRNYASLVRMLGLPTTSLLGMVGSPVGTEPRYQDPAEQELPASAQARADRRDYSPLRLTFAVDDRKRRVQFELGPTLTGNAYQLVARLAAEFREDVGTANAKSAYTFVPTRTLMKDLGTTDVNLRQWVNRLRRSLERQFLECADYHLDENDFIESDTWKGYRINPFVFLVEAGQLADDQMSRTSRPKVTTRT